LIRTIITEDLGIRNDNISFGKNPYGKPYLKDYPNFNFNISHSGDFVVCAIDNNPIGVDIEEIKYMEYEDIAKNFFTTDEFDYITKNDSYSSLSRFYEIWTLKESFIKCCGRGLAMPLKSLSIGIDEYKNIRVFTDGKHKDYIFKSSNMEINYRISICSLSKEISNDITIIDQDCLINRYLDQVRSVILMVLFCLPYAGGSESIYYKWKRYLKHFIELEPIELKGRGKKRFNETFYESLEEAVDDIFENIKDKIAEDDFAIYGHIMGSLLAYELYYKIGKLNVRKPKHIFFPDIRHLVL
jgi:4'-phosphopantetheinyl transferase